MARPTQYPRQLVMQVTEPLAERVDTDAAARPDGSKSAAARRLLTLGTILADALARDELDPPLEDAQRDRYNELLDDAAEVR